AEREWGLVGEAGVTVRGRAGGGEGAGQQRVGHAAILHRMERALLLGQEERVETLRLLVAEHLLRAREDVALLLGDVVLDLLEQPAEELAPRAVADLRHLDRRDQVLELAGLGVV